MPRGLWKADAVEKDDEHGIGGGLGRFRGVTQLRRGFGREGNKFRFLHFVWDP